MRTIIIAGLTVASIALAAAPGASAAPANGAVIGERAAAGYVTPVQYYNYGYRRYGYGYGYRRYGYGYRRYGY
jgi:hypothetical protein